MILVLHHHFEGFFLADLELKHYLTARPAGGCRDQFLTTLAAGNNSNFSKNTVGMLGNSGIQGHTFSAHTRGVCGVFLICACNYCAIFQKNGSPNLKSGVWSVGMVGSILSFVREIF